MPDSKITDLVELVGGAVAMQEDLIEVVDMSATTNKKATVASIVGPPPSAQVSDATYTFVAADAFRMVMFNSASSQIAYIPSNGAAPFAIGTRIRIYRRGVGSVKVAPAASSGVILNLPTGITPKRMMGARLRISADQTASNYSAGPMILFNAETYDTDAFHDTAANTSRMVIPAGLGIRKVDVSFSAGIGSVTASTQVYANLYKNGAYGIDSSGIDAGSTGTTRSTSFSAKGVPVTDADYLEIQLGTAADTSTTLTAYGTQFSLHVTEIDAQGFVAYQNGSIEIMKIGTDEWVVTDQTALG